ncbi:hypothetical protein DL95DRAFT_508474 [Leptodontidium sp. 2 PMI_412]|nr:hypothetical protein DL95DRAFT_508474 [Leptodontidium sp. 2 PMI_412]
MDNSVEDNSRALGYLALITSLFILGLLCFLARIFSRAIPSYRLNASDYVSAVAVITITVAYSLFVASIHKGLGRHIQFLTGETIVDILRFSVFVKLFGTTGATLTRLSIALQLLPFSTSVTWKAALWGIAALEVASLVALILFTFLQVLPVSVNWDGSGYTGRIVAIYVFIGASVFGDLWCSIMPLFLIWDLSRSKLERCLLSMLITLGLCATAAAITTLVLLLRLRKSSDALRDSLPIYTWCLVEEATLLVASCAPLLKALVEKALRRLGFPGFRNIPRELGDYPSNRLSHKSRWHITRKSGKQHGSTSQYHANTAVVKDSGDGSNALPSYNTDHSNSDFGPPSTKVAVSIRMEGLARNGDFT